MSDPIEYRVLQNLQTAIAAATVAGGYHFDMPTGAVKLDPNSSVEELLAVGGLRPFVYLEPKSEVWRYVSMPNGLEVEWPVIVHFVHDSDPTDDNSRAKVFFEGCADVERAVTRDLSRGGLAVDTKVTHRIYTPYAGAQVWAQVQLTIRVKRRYGAPNGETS